MKLNAPLNRLLPVAFLATAPVAQAQDRSPDRPLEWSGFARTVIEDGKDVLPNLIVNGEKDGWRLDGALDIYENPKGETSARPFFATVSRDFGGETVRCGLQAPFFNTSYSDLLIKGLPPLLSDRAAALNGGIVGCDVRAARKLGTMTLTAQAYAGAKPKGLDFGPDGGPGVDALVAGGGASLSRDFARGKVEAGYRYTHFGEGPAGGRRAQNYAYISARYKPGATEFRLLGEIANDRVCNPRACSSKTTANVIGQVYRPLGRGFDGRLSAAWSDGAPVADAMLVYNISPKARVQIGVGRDFKANETSAGIGLAVNF